MMICAALSKTCSETMYHAPGIGLAGVQVGVTRRIFTVDCAKEGEGQGPDLHDQPENHLAIG